MLYNILICDDDRDIVSALDIYLTSDGYKTYHAYDGLEALKIVEERGPRPLPAGLRLGRGLAL